MNLMTDMPEMTISTDNVDMEIVESPRQWDIKFIRKLMIVFGLLSTIFDYATFGTLFCITFCYRSIQDCMVYGIGYLCIYDCSCH